MTAPCVFFTEGRREPDSPEACGKPARRAAKAPPWSDIPELPICEDCVDNTNWPPHLLAAIGKHGVDSRP